ncbi:MAG: heme-binding domain-containing protein [Anaerolineales bacterium]|nr:heme-binding domain-containing protein [Anaerolineales bacterium]
MSQKSSPMLRVVGIGAGVVAALAVGIQLVPYGRDHSNPPVVTETNWDSPQTRELFYRACADCHSNETKWPWYSNVAPVSWLVQRDVEEGREHFNISDATAGDHSHSGHDESPSEPVSEGEMPMPIYLVTHPEARLTEAEKQQLIAGLDATFGGEESVIEHRLASLP